MTQAQTSKNDDPEFAKLVAKGKEQLAELKPWYIKKADKVFEVHCLTHGEVIALEAIMPGRKERGHIDGAVVIPLGDQLTSFRVRGDGTMGYSCQCGATSILLKEEAILNETHAMYPHIEERIKDELEQRTRAPKQLFKRVEVK